MAWTFMWLASLPFYPILSVFAARIIQQTPDHSGFDPVAASVLVASIPLLSLLAVGFVTCMIFCVVWIL